MSAMAVVESSPKIAASVCVYTNDQLVLESMPLEGDA